MHVPVCEVTILMLEWDNVISTLCFPINIFERTFYCSPHFWQLQFQLSFGHTDFLPTVLSSISVFFLCYLTFLPLGTHLPFFLISKGKSLFSHASLLPCLLDCQHLGIAASVPLEDDAVMGSSTCRNIFPGYSFVS